MQQHMLFELPYLAQILNFNIMTKKQSLEFIPLAIFFLSAIGFILKVPFAAVMALVSGLFAASLYFYGAFWLFAETGLSTMNRIVAGFIYSIGIIACIFCLLNWPMWKLYGIISCAGLAIIIAVCLFHLKMPTYKAQLFRCIFFLVMLFVICCYRICAVKY
jgi:hypothetical protein